jgi:8-oxo-dGTP pyrophosphatase MutT (NUDIX family)
MIRGGQPEDSELLRRTHLGNLIAAIDPWDDQERGHLTTARDWIDSGAPIYRTRKPDVPAMHVVSYFVVLDERRRELLLVAHRTSGLWLPSGGHVEPAEDPWDAVVRECREELDMRATPSKVSADRPFFLTISRTRGLGEHTDVSLWYIVRGDATAVGHYDDREFAAIRWLPLQQVFAEPVETLDPHMHRFSGKLIASLA